LIEFMQSESAVDASDLRTPFLWLAAAVLAAAGIAAVWDGRLSLGIAAGGWWNLASLWCLMRLLRAWTAAPRAGARPNRRALGWLALKLAGLYPLAILFLSSPDNSKLGFGAGFTLVLGAGLAWIIWQTQRTMLARAHGR
jgi:hypothetical protein